MATSGSCFGTAPAPARGIGQKTVQDLLRWSTEHDISAYEALTRIVEMFEAEIARLTDVGSTTPRSQQGH